MNDTNLPPIPDPGATGPQVCEIIRLYLAVMQDLTPEQIALLSRHVHKCPDCAEAFRRLSRTTQLVASGLAPSAPSPRVDRAIMAALSTQNGGQAAKPFRKMTVRRRTSNRATWLVRSLATAAVIVVALLGAMLLNGVSPVATGPQRFSLPQNLSWNGYVLYHSETGMGSNGAAERWLRPGPIRSPIWAMSWQPSGSEISTGRCGSCRRRRARSSRSMTGASSACLRMTTWA